MKCPECHKEDVKVIESRDINNGYAIRRRRMCEKCGYRFTTYERYFENILVKKKDKSIEPYDSEKIRRGIEASTKKLSIKKEELENTLKDIDKKVEEYAVKHGNRIKSSIIGKIILEELKSLSDVAAIRFASVYREFNTTEEFIKEIESLKPNSP